MASGDVDQDSAVLWARSTETGEVAFTVYEVRPGGRLVEVAEQTAEVTDTEVPVRAHVEGLEAGTDYVYRVEDSTGTALLGRFSTAAADGHEGLTFAVTGDWRGDLAPYPAVANMAGANLDFAILLGDTIYADYDTPDLGATTELEGYRIKYQEVYGSRAGENFWAEIRASMPVLAMIDDHEVINDFAGGADAASDERLPETEGLVNDTAAFEAGLQAFQEYHPVEDRFFGETGDDRTEGERDLYRSQSYGEDAAVFVLDQRSFRDDQIPDALGSIDPEEIRAFQEASLDPERTMLGEAQLDRFKADLLAADAAGVTWKFVMTPEPIQNLGLNNADSWEGYQAERNEILRFIEDEGIDNVVFVAADIHATFVNNLTYAEEVGGAQIATSTWEITTGSVGFADPFGPTVVDVAVEAGLLPSFLEGFYDNLPIAPDADSRLNDKDDFLEFAFNTLTLSPQGLDLLGLDNNLPQAEGLIDATLLQGDYVAAHTFGWTEFDIDAETQALTVTTYGIPGYTPEEVAADPEAILALEPQIVSQFVVMPEFGDEIALVEATAARERLDGAPGIDGFVFEIGDSTRTARDTIEDFHAGDLIDLTDFGFADVLAGPRSLADADTLAVTGALGDRVFLTGGEGPEALALRVEGDLEDVLAGLLTAPEDSPLA